MGLTFKIILLVSATSFGPLRNFVLAPQQSECQHQYHPVSLWVAVACYLFAQAAGFWPPAEAARAASHSV